jgi:hypothetical protein
MIFGLLKIKNLIQMIFNLFFFKTYASEIFFVHLVIEQNGENKI